MVPSAEGTCLFETPFGVCGLAWSARGVTSFQLPEADAAETAARLARRGVPAAPPSAIEAARDALRRYFAGEAVDLDGIVLDLGGVPPSERGVYDETRRIGRGETTTYGVLAARVGAPGAARAIGRAMGRNPIPVIVPCHRVLASGDRMGGFSAHGGTVTKERLLRLEGAAAVRQLAIAFA